MVNTLVRSMALSIPAIRTRYDSINSKLAELENSCQAAKDTCRLLREERDLLASKMEVLMSTQETLLSERNQLKFLLNHQFSRILGKLSTMEYSIDARLQGLEAATKDEDEVLAVDESLIKTHLDFVEKALVGLLYCDEPMESTGHKSFKPELREVGWDWPKQALTMIGTARMRNLRMLCESVIKRKIPGDFIETGVWRGGACIYMKAIARAYNQTRRKIWVADSFEGLPVPDAEKYPADAGDPHHTLKELAIPLETVKGNFERFGLLDDQVCFLKGWFKDTLPKAPVEQLAILRLDGDMYESTMDALTALYDRVSDGGFVIIDDYCLETCVKAVTDFRNERGIFDPLIEVDGIAVYWQKSARE